MIVAVPSSAPGGLEAPVSAHFGHSECYTLITVEKNQITAVEIISNVPHAQGGCMAPVRYLAHKGATALIAGGMGQRPLAGFNQNGINVYYDGKAQTVGQALDALLNGNLSLFNQNHTCGGGDCHHQHRGAHAISKTPSPN